LPLDNIETAIPYRQIILLNINKIEVKIFGKIMQDFVSLQANNS
jgi:hypothetical protein